MAHGKVLAFQRQIGPKVDRTWEDLDVPTACCTAMDIVATLREHGVTGVFRVVFERDGEGTVMTSFAITEVRSYEARFLDD